MSRKTVLTAVCALVCAVAASCSYSRADEGMWLYSAPPLEKIKDKYGVELSSDFLEHLQKSSLKFANSGSASFVSSNGLIMTNHHVGLSTVAGLSTKERNLVQTGFKANSYEEEIKCPGLKLVMLQEIRDVTERVEKALQDADAQDDDKARAKIFKEISDEAKAETGLRCDVVTLFQGGLYHLYCYKEFTDLRLVFTPEESVGFFGGDPDNFGYPRYNLDVTFFRAYENDKPYKPEHFLRWSENGAADGECVFVSGHPARTNRFNTVADLEYQRDVFYPWIMNKLNRREVLYQVFGSFTEENQRRIATDLFRIQNSRKNRGGIIQGLQTPALMQRKIDDEKELRALAKEKNAIDFAKGDPWEAVEKAVNEWAPKYPAYDLIGANEAFAGQTMGRAFAVARYCIETAKPEDQRRPGYKESELAERKKDFDNPAPKADIDIEILKLGDSLSHLYETSKPVEGGRTLGGDVVLSDELFAKIYDGQNPKARANSIIRNTKVADVDFCKSILDGGLDALKEANDPALNLALAVEPLGAELRDIYAKFEEVRTREYARIAKARFKVYGDNVYPDATFTLRLTYGVVEGYTEDDGTKVPFETYIKGALDHAREHGRIDPYDLAQSWFDAEKDGRAPLDAPINFVTNHDIIGGNSGSPCVNAKGEVVGLIFDGNIQSLVLNFIFDDVQARAVLVHSVGIREAIRSIYNMPALADELGK